MSQYETMSSDQGSGIYKGHQSDRPSGIWVMTWPNFMRIDCVRHSMSSRGEGRGGILMYLVVLLKFHFLNFMT